MADTIGIMISAQATGEFWDLVGAQCFFLKFRSSVRQNNRISNDHGNRTAPSYVSFSDKGRLIGDAAKKKVSTNPHVSLPLSFSFSFSSSSSSL